MWGSSLYVAVLLILSVPILTWYFKVTSTQAADVDTLLVPIAPSPKNRDTNMQLNIANVGFGWSGRLLYRLQFNSYLRVDKVYEVPLNVLEPFLWS